MTNNKLGKRLKATRVENKLTQTQLATNIGVTLSVIAGAETKRGISKSLASKLAEYFKTDINFWINEDAENEFIEQHELLETTKLVVQRLIDEELLTNDNIESMDKDIYDLIFQSFKFDIKVALKKKGN